MKLFYSPASPFVRKVLAVAHELGLQDRIDRVPAAAGPVDRNAEIRSKNPLGQVPTLLTDDGQAIYDSRVICEYLNDMGRGTLFGQGAERWRNLTEAALGDGLLGGALLARYETFLRPEPLRWDGWVEGQLGKVDDGLARLEELAPGFGDRVDIATITFGCGLGYLDFRFANRPWRETYPKAAEWFARFSERPSMKATAPTG